MFFGYIIIMSKLLIHLWRYRAEKAFCGRKVEVTYCGGLYPPVTSYVEYATCKKCLAIAKEKGYKGI